MKGLKTLTIILAICFAQIAYGQNASKNSDKPVTIAGKVLTASQLPVSGAVFYVDNVKTSYITKSDGSYKIKISPSAVKLKVVSSEFGSSETLIAGNNKINFTLGESEDQHLNEDIAGYINTNSDIDDKSKKSRVKKVNTYTDIYQMIRNEVTGVVVSGRNIQIQQGKSFFGSSTPLFVINGVVVNSIDDVNPLEVKSIEVLKGSSAAIYGVRGSNGVISINLINGSENEK